LLAAIVASSDDAIISKTLDGIITSWNEGAERIFGYEPHEVIGQPITILIPPERQGEEIGILARIREGQRVNHYETLRRRKDGSPVDIARPASPSKGRGGRVSGAAKTARDITERKRPEEAQRTLSREVTHRSKNLLAVVQSIIRYTVARSPPKDFLRRI